MKLSVGDPFPATSFATVAGAAVAVPNPTGLVHLQFRRYVGCPICNIHIRSFVKRADEVKAAGVREVIVFHSWATEMKSLQRKVPFDLVADPKKVHYKAFGVETSFWSMLSAKTIWAVIRGTLRGYLATKSTGGPNGLPADLLIDPTGRVAAVKYGRRAYDQWSVDELLALAAAARGNVEREAVSAPASG
jgi:peroxiredoxin